MSMQIKEVILNDTLLHDLLTLSEEWEQEQSCYGYRKNEKEDLESRRIFTAQNESGMIGYLFGQIRTSDKETSIMPQGTTYFELEELFVRQAFRSSGIGRQLFERLEDSLKKDNIHFLLLSAAAKNYKAVMHFYLDEMDMEFWSARLFKRF